MCRFYFNLLFVAFLGPLFSFANSRDSLSKYDKLDAAEVISAGFTYQQGDVALGTAAILQVPAGYRFLDARQAKLLLEKVWGNPENPGVAGFLLPVNVAPLDHDVWGLAVSFETSGYLSHQEAGHIDYNQLLRKMMADNLQDNNWRMQHGQKLLTGMQWAFSPYFDKKANTLHWARILRFEQGQQILNYEMRILQRHGALCFNAVAGISRLKKIRELLPVLARQVHFTPGNNYIDFNPRTDPFAIWPPEVLMVSRLLCIDNLLECLEGTWLFLAVSLLLILFVYAMQLYHRRRTYLNKIARIDERLN